MFYLHLMGRHSEAQRGGGGTVGTGQRLCSWPPSLRPPRKVPKVSDCIVGGWDSGGGSVPLTCLCLPFPTEERRAREWPIDSTELPEGCLEDWLEKRAKRLSSAPSSRYRPSGSPSLSCPLGARPQPACPDLKLNNFHELPKPRCQIGT